MKTFWARRPLRERALLLLFTLSAFAWWGPAAIARAATLVRDWRSLATEREAQSLWLANRDTIAGRAAAAAKILDPAKTLDASRAFAELTRLTTGLTAEIGGQRTGRTEQFALHSMQVTIRRADLAALLSFYSQLSALAPYLAIEQCLLATDRANPGRLDAVFRIYAVEITRPPS